MRKQDWYDLGDKIEDLVQNAINSGDFRQLNENINKTLDKVVREGEAAVRQVFGQELKDASSPSDIGQTKAKRPMARAQSARPVPARTQRMLYARTGGPKAQGIMEILLGSCLILGGGATLIGILATVLVTAIVPVGGWVAGLLLSLLVTGGGIFALARGLRMNRLVGHFRWFCTRLRDRTYCEVKELARYVGKSEKEIRKELYWMIAKGWFRQGHLDSTETTLITSNQTYEEYLKLQRQREEAARDRQLQAQKEQAMSGDERKVQEVLERGAHYLWEIKESKDAIPGEVISGKIAHMETVVQRILLRAKEHPEVIPDLDKLMDYYLPTTVKLLDAYEELIIQPVQGENIRNSKREIEDTLDTLNLAFEKLLDSIFQDEAWDISSDITVLHTILAQEGLTREDFQR